LGWQPVFFSEIEDFPSEVLSTHYPNVPNHGDMTNFEDWSYERGAIDVICGGTPCQSFSVAGLRKGLSDDRGNLALTFCRMVERLRPKYFIWENVPGCLSSNEGRDFGSITGAMAQFGYVFGWRVFDAKYFGVPQRRRRVFLVGCASGQPEHIRQILFEPESSRGNSAESQETWQDSARNIGHGTEVFDFQRIGQYGTKGIGSTCMARDCKDSKDLVVYECHHADSRVKELGQACQTVTTKWGTGGNNVPLVYESHPIDSRVKQLEKTSPTVTVKWAKGSADTPLVALSSKMSEPDLLENVAPTVKVGGSGGGNPPAVATEKLVRRLTPIEVERLQGFPDDYTNIPWRGKTAPDNRRYKAMGNSMAVPVMRWLGQRISDLEGGIK
jgi:DNA (cytosine-5)-methyltransferase 1